MHNTLHRVCPELFVSSNNLLRTYVKSTAEIWTITNSQNHDKFCQTDNKFRFANLLHCESRDHVIWSNKILFINYSDLKT